MNILDMTKPKTEKTGLDPKGAAGALKAPMQLLPPPFLIEMAWVAKLGGEKYGPFNWRENSVESMTYVGAIMRHLAAWVDGEDVDPESGKSHLAHIALSCGIVIDAEKFGTLQDNRPPSKKSIDISH
jgi:hypothetical protein